LGKPDGTFQAKPGFQFQIAASECGVSLGVETGSTFFVWTQNRADSQYPGAISPAPDFNALVHTPADNVFLVKTTAN